MLKLIEPFAKSLADRVDETRDLALIHEARNVHAMIVAAIRIEERMKGRTPIKRDADTDRKTTTL